MALRQCIFTVLVIIALVPRFTSRVVPEAALRLRHEEWMTRFEREYKDAAEKEKRYSIFRTNAEYIDSVNNGKDVPYKLSVNQFADQTNEEFMAAYMSFKKSPMTKLETADSFHYENVTALPPSIDWRKKGAVTPIRNETCGGWTFPAVDSVEGITKIRNGTLYTLSVQEILDCDTNGGGNSCSGGSVYDAFDFITKNGLTTASNYPSRDEPGTCDKNKEAQPVAKITSYKSVPVDEKALMQAVANQPVAVSIDASGPSFQFYSSGVFTGQCGTTLDHGVTIVGYGTENGKLKYWIVKNSWGATWGEEGYMRLEKDVDEKSGLCGVALEALYPVADC